MRLTFGPPPTDLSEEDMATGGWQRLPQPPFWVLYLLVLPVGAVLTALIAIAWVMLTPDVDIDIGSSAQIIGVSLAVLLLGMLAQIAAYPGGFSQAILGFWASRFMLYTGHAGPLTKTRHVLELSLPCLLLSVGPLLVVAATRVTSGWLIYASCLTAFAFGLNAVLALSVAWQLPAGAQVRWLRFQTYWRVPAP